MKKCLKPPTRWILINTLALASIEKMERRSTKRIIEVKKMWNSLEIHRAMVATPGVGISVVFVAVEVAVFVCDFVAVPGDELVFQCLYILLIISFFW